MIGSAKRPVGRVAGAGTLTAALRALQDEAQSKIPALDYTVPYAIGNILLTAWGPVIAFLDDGPIARAAAAALGFGSSRVIRRGIGLRNERGDSGVIVMMVRDVMTRRLVVIGPETPCDKARLIMDEYRVRHLPVMAGGQLIGMVSDRDVRSAIRSAPDNVASRIMTPEPVTVTPETRIEHAARTMLDGRFGALPVVDGHLVGIVTYTDLLRAFVQVLETATLERITVEVTAGS